MKFSCCFSSIVVTALVSALVTCPVQAFIPTCLAGTKSLSQSLVHFHSEKTAIGVSASGADDVPSSKYTPLPSSVQPGVLHGEAMMDLINHAKENGYAIPAVNCVSSSSVNFALEAAAANNAPVMIQFSSGGSQFFAGKGAKDKSIKSMVAGAISGAQHVHAVAHLYGVPIILHTDHASMKLLPWVDSLVEHSEALYKEKGHPLFSSHMIDLSEEPVDSNLEICSSFMSRMEKIGMLLEMELGITGGEEDGVNNSDRPSELLYTTPEDIYKTYKQLGQYSDKFTIAAAFGNVHGVYRPGNVKLDPEILHNAQEYVSDMLGNEAPKHRLPVSYVFHGGSGSDVAAIKKAISYGVVKMNIDTDTQWSYWNGIRQYEAKYHDYLQGQLGNPDGEDKPNKKYYDPRAYLRVAEEHAVARLQQCFNDLNCQNITSW